MQLNVKAVRKNFCCTLSQAFTFKGEERLQTLTALKAWPWSAAVGRVGRRNWKALEGTGHVLKEPGI